MPSPQNRDEARVSLLRALLDAWPRVETLAPAERAALEAITCGVLSWSWDEPAADPAIRKAGRERMRALGIVGAAADAWLAGLAAAGHAPETLQALEDAGLVERWDVAGGVAYTLSAVGAFHLAVELVEIGGDDDPETRWSPIDPTPRPIKLVQRFGCEQAIIDRLMDGGLGPDEAAELAEEVSRRRVPTEPVLDPWSGEALVLFAGPDGSGGVPVLRDHRRDHPMKGVPSRSKPAAKPAPKAKATPKPKVTPKPKPKPAGGKAASKAPRPGPTPGPSKAAGRPRPRTPATPTPGTFDLIDQYRASREAARSTGRTVGREVGG